jgi:hypothetical protein
VPERASGAHVWHEIMQACPLEPGHEPGLVISDGREPADAVSFPGVDHHQLRYTLATQAINRGMSLEAIAALLGHRSLDMTLRYANPQELHQAGEDCPD